MTLEFLIGNKDDGDDNYDDYWLTGVVNNFYNSSDVD